MLGKGTVEILNKPQGPDLEQGKNKEQTLEQGWLEQASSLGGRTPESPRGSEGSGPPL